jgi:rhodanese-related sulfurtransferase
VLLVEWQGFPDSRPNGDFVAHLQSELDGVGADRTWSLYFLCRSGVRSLSAAKAMAAEGYGRCFNVANGFEGPLDADRHRGRAAGWKAAGLPWVQG